MQIKNPQHIIPPPQVPEKLSGHDLADYLISNPDIRGNFKWHTLRSCMWRDLLIAQPGFVDVADFEKIHHHDIYKILLEQPQLAPYFDFSKLWDGENRCLFLKRPEIATPETTAFLYTSTWSEILKKHPHLAHLCPIRKFYPCDWINLISSQISFADQCLWAKFTTHDWKEMVQIKNCCLKFLKMEYLTSADSLGRILRSCYLGKTHSAKGAFEQGVPDAASYLIFKRMDRVNGKHFLKMQLKNQNWDFVEELCSISPEETLDVYTKKYIRFFITLDAPDNVFEKLFPLFDLTERDPAGNAHLLAALVRGISENDMNRYNFLLTKGLDPDEKNFAGFSCNDWTAYLKNCEARAAAEKSAREEWIREKVRRRMQKKKGK